MKYNGVGVNEDERCIGRTRKPDISPETMAKLKAVFEGFPGLEEVVLYGSRAIGAATPRSDIDLATRGIEDDHLLGRLALDLEDLDIPQKVDVQRYEGISYLPLKRHIAGLGISLYKRKSS